ncbi:hypothetical protein RIVM261_083480 [Rivularia sp. IAM M-261]|nr:hypothetical protein RIVM261_083480 [Rivularia sp. IAM M-261]
MTQLSHLEVIKLNQQTLEKSGQKKGAFGIGAKFTMSCEVNDGIIVLKINTKRLTVRDCAFNILVVTKVKISTQTLPYYRYSVLHVYEVHK